MSSGMMSKGKHPRWVPRYQDWSAWLNLPESLADEALRAKLPVHRWFKQPQGEVQPLKHKYASELLRSKIATILPPEDGLSLIELYNDYYTKLDGTNSSRRNKGHSRILAKADIRLLDVSQFHNQHIGEFFVVRLHNDVTGRATRSGSKGKNKTSFSYSRGHHYFIFSAILFDYGECIFRNYDFVFFLILMSIILNFYVLPSRLFPSSDALLGSTSNKFF